MKILITGSDGFIGENLKKKLLENKKNKLICFTKKNKKNLTNLKFIKVEDIYKVKEDILYKLCKDIDIIYHLAWYTNPKDYLNSRKNIKCYYGTIKFAKIIKKLHLKFICLGSCNEYKFTNKILTVKSPTYHNSLYSKYKIKTQKQLFQIFKNSNAKVFWLRLFFLHSQKNTEFENCKRLFPSIRRNIKKNKKTIIKNSHFIRDFLTVKQVCSQLVKIKKFKNSQIFNICSGKGISLKNLCIKYFHKKHFVFLKENSGTMNTMKIVGKRML